MANLFDYDWFHGSAFQQQQHQARMRCALKKFPNLDSQQVESDPAFQKCLNELEARTLVYLRDGFSYEMKELVDTGLKGLLSFECEPVEEQYKVGAFIVSVLFEEIVRVEIFAVHPGEKPEDTPIITGFRNKPPDYFNPREDSRDVRDMAGDPDEED
jgi:hypothetical protein